MSAETLRKAASLMRERATSVTGGHWEAGERCVWANSKSPSVVYVIVSDGEAGDGGAIDSETAEHIASWHPAVALAVADLLSFVAEVWQDDTECHWPIGPDEPCGECADCDRRWTQARAIAVARAYLGGDA